MRKAGLPGASGVASADSAPPAASAMGVPPNAPLPKKAAAMATAVPTSVMTGNAHPVSAPVERSVAGGRPVCAWEMSITS